MSKRSILEISLDRICLDAAGGGDRETGNHAVVARLLWPRPAIAEKVSMKTAVLDAGSLDWRREDWATKILFKETVQGRFAVEISVTDKMSDAQTSRFLKGLCSSVLGSLSGDVGDALPGAGGMGLMTFPLKYLSKELSPSRKSSPRLIAEGCVDIDPTSLKKGGKDRTINIPLVAPRSIHEITRRRRHGKLTMKRRLLCGAGEKNGHATISMKAYG